MTRQTPLDRVSSPWSCVREASAHEVLSRGLGLLSFLMAVLLVGGVPSHADGTNRPVVLIAVIGSSNSDGAEPDENNPDDGSGGDDPYVNGSIGQATEERREEYQDKGFAVELRHFGSLKEFLCWLCEHAPDTYAHVEMYGHGSPAEPKNSETSTGWEPEGGWPPPPVGDPVQQASTSTQLWRTLGKALKKVMLQTTHEGGSITGGHIVFGWCSASQGGATSTLGNVRPGAIVAAAAGIPVYAPAIDVGYEQQGPDSNPHHTPSDDYPEGYGEPFGQPQPDGGTELPGLDPEVQPGRSGWVKFPPTSTPLPGQGAPGVVTPAEASDVGLPVSDAFRDNDADDKGDPDAGDTPEDSNDPSNDGDPATEDDVAPAAAPEEEHANVEADENPCEEVDCD